MIDWDRGQVLIDEEGGTTISHRELSLTADGQWSVRFHHRHVSRPPLLRIFWRLQDRWYQRGNARSLDAQLATSN